MTARTPDKADIQVKRIYDTPEDTDGKRILVDRVWPRGLPKDKAALDDWLKGLAPSTELRKWFAHAPDRWTAFRQRYLEELREQQPEALGRLRQRLAESERVTLLFGSREREMNNAVALKRFLDEDLL